MRRKREREMEAVGKGKKARSEKLRWKKKIDFSLTCLLKEKMLLIIEILKIDCPGIVSLYRREA